MRIILSDLKELFHRKAVFLLMFLGIVAGAFALVVYYVSGTADLSGTDAAFNTKRVIEFKVHDSIQGGDIIYSLIQGNAIPEVDYVAGLSYDKEEYDIIALYYDDSYDAPYKGRYIDKNDIGSFRAVITKSEENKSIGDNYRINGISFEIVGITDPTRIHIGNYDYRRIPQGEEFVAGVELARDPSLENRPDKCVFIPLDMMDEINMTPSYYHITFKEDISEKEKEEIYSTILLAFGTDGIEFTDITPYSETHAHVKYVRLIIYSFALIMGIVNVISIFNYFLKSNKKTYATYKMLGATDEKIALTILAELLILCLVGFILALVFAYLFVEYSGFVEQHLPVGIAELLVIFLLFYLVAVFLSLKEIRSLWRGNAITLQKGSNKISSNEKNENISISNKYVYLLSFRYNRTAAVGTLSIILLSFLCALTFSFAMTYVAESSFYSRYLDKISFSDIGVLMVTPGEYEDAIIEYQSSGGENTDSLATLNEYDKRVKNISGITDYANCGDFVGPIRETKDGIWFYSHIGSNDFWRNIQYPLKAGSWEKLQNYDINSIEPVPVIVDEKTAQKYPIGTIATWEVITENEDIEKDGQHYSIDYYSTREFEVVGIISSDAYVLSNFAPYQDFVKIDYYFTSIEETYKIIDDNDGIIFLPNFMVDGVAGNAGGLFENYYKHISGASYVFSDGQMESSLEEWNESIKDFAKIDSFDRCVERYEEIYKSGGGNTYFMHATITAVLLIFGIGGYSIISFFSLRHQFGIYYTCGMPWGYAIRLMLLGNGVDILIPGIGGAFVGIFSSDTLRSFNFDSKVIAMLSGISFVISVYIITSVLLIIYLKNKTPHSLINQKR